MKYLDWLESISRNCPRAVNVRGGAMCRQGRILEYCDLKKCPRVDEKERGRYR